MPNYKYLHRFDFEDFSESVAPEFLIHIRTGRINCVLCNALITTDNASVVGMLSGARPEILHVCACKSCRTIHGDFAKTSRLMQETMESELFKEKLHPVDLGQIQPGPPRRDQ